MGLTTLPRSSAGSWSVVAERASPCRACLSTPNLPRQCASHRVDRRALSRQISIGDFRRRIRPSALVIREQKQWSSSPPWCASRQYRIYSDNAQRLHQYPACGGWAQEDETILQRGFLGPWYCAVRPPGLARTVRVLEDLRMRSAGVVTRTKFGRVKIGSLSSGSGRGGGSPRPERFVSEDAERAAGGEMALDVERVLDGGVNRQETLG
jgi:hypothetical protein